MMERDVPARECPDEETLTGLVEDRLDPAARDDLERHVAACPRCLDTVAAVLPADASLSDEQATADGPAGPRLATVADQPARTAAPPRGAAASRAPRSRPRRRGFRFAAVGAVAAGVALVLMGRHRVEEALADRLAERVSAAVGVRVSIHGLGVALTPDLRGISFRLTGLHLGPREQPLSGAADASVVLPLATLLHGEPHIDRVEIHHPAIYVPESAAAAAPSGGQPKVRLIGPTELMGAILRGPSLAIDDGQLTLALADAAPLRIEHLSGATLRRGDILQLAFRGLASGGALTLEGAARDGGIDVEVGARGIPVEVLPHLRRWLAGTADGRVRVGGKLGDPGLEGRLLVRNGQVHARSLLGSVAIDPILEQLRARVVAGLVTGELPFDELRAAYAHRHGRWRVPRLVVTSAGVVAGGSFDVSPDGVLTGRGVVRIPPEAAAGVVAALPVLADYAAEDGTVSVPLRIAGTVAAPSVLPGW